MTFQDIRSRLDSRATIEESGTQLRVTVPQELWSDTVVALGTELALPLATMFATDDRARTNTFGVHAIFSLDEMKGWCIVDAALPAADPRYPSVTRRLMAAHWYERAMADMFGIIPEGHPDPRRLIHHENVPAGTHPLRKDFAWNTKMAHADVAYPLHSVTGEGVYEIPVGPIHAGIIEPGHFRFNVAGERILTLEGKLFFTHKGVEKLVEGKAPMAALPFIERVSGDMAASHALAFCQAIEQIGAVTIPARAAFLRSVIAECERVTMHVHDLANIAGMGTGFSIMAAAGFRIKERLMRLSDAVVGNRFWRGVIVPGGLSRDWTKDELATLLKEVQSAVDEMVALVEMGLSSEGLRERLETTGVMSKAVALAYGAQGLPARASGINRDARRDHPYAAYASLKPIVFIKETGDVSARYLLRLEELQESARLITGFLTMLPEGGVRVACDAKDGEAIGSVEAWRGEIVTVVRLANGLVDRCSVRDPSFCNWPLFGEIGPGNIVPDFPLCNKSLNLSYSGTDL